MSKKVIGWSIAGIAILLPFQALAKPEWYSDFRAEYPSVVGTRLDSCSFCHAGTFPKQPTPNVYAVNWKENGRNFAAVENMDSDGDSFSNIVEINALTFPGDATDFPAGGMIGDVNNDGGIDSLDATLIKLLLLFGGDAAGLNDFLASLGQNPIDTAFADINLDGKADSLDATLLTLYVLFGKDLAALNDFLGQQGLGFTAHIGETT